MSEESKKANSGLLLRSQDSKDLAGTFQAPIDGKCAPIISSRDDGMDTDSMITTYNTAVTDSAVKILGKKRSTCDKKKFEEEVV